MTTATAVVQSADGAATPPHTIDIDRLLTAEAVREFFTPSHGHPPVAAPDIPNLEALWIANSDDGLRAREQVPALMRENFPSAAPASAPGTGCAVADRYGGFGISQNGGSGRAAAVGPFHIKGVGRTALVDPRTEAGHASGGAYLEECVRETIFSQIFAAEFPYGAVPSLAIFLTGVLQHWPEGISPPTEKRCLLVRPLFLRPAHFDRALFFRNGEPAEAAADDRRVAAMCASAVRRWGAEGAAQVFIKSWERWTEQLAYGYAHRLCHGGSTESNVALGGALLDFGASTSLPTWAPFVVAEGGMPAGAEVGNVIRSVMWTAPQLARHVHPSLGTPEFVQGATAALPLRFGYRVLFEFLRLMGLTRKQASAVMSSDRAAAIDEDVRAFIARWGRSEQPIFAGIEFKDGPLEGRSLWEAREDFPELAHLYSRSVRVLSSDNAARRLHALRSRFRCRPRPALFRDVIKTALHEALDDDDSPTAVDALIRRVVVENLRDPRLEPEDYAVVRTEVSASEARYTLEDAAGSRMTGEPHDDLAGWTADRRRSGEPLPTGSPA